MAPLVSTAIFGVGASCLFNPIINYLTDAYPTDAASVLASVSSSDSLCIARRQLTVVSITQNDFIRSAFGAGMPLVAHGLFVNLKVDWGTSLLGFVSLCFLPLPFGLYFVSDLRRPLPRTGLSLIDLQHVTVWTLPPSPFSPSCFSFLKGSRSRSIWPAVSNLPTSALLCVASIITYN